MKTLLLLFFAFSAPAQAEKANDFSLRNLDNEEVKLSDYQGKVVLVNFWATWCAPCQVEMPYLQQMQTDFSSQGFEVLSISVDDSRSASRVKPLINSKGYTFTVVLDKETEVVSQYNPNKVLPYSFIVDQQGEIIYRHQGYNAGDELELRTKVQELLGTPAAPTE